MIGTTNNFYSSSHPTFISDDTNIDLENNGENSDHSLRRQNSSFPSSPIEDRKYFSSFSSSENMVNCSKVKNNKEHNNYGWPSYNIPLNCSTYDDNENVTNAPLNLSLNSNDSLEPDTVKHATPQLLSLPNSKSVAQFILTSGQMVQGIQGAQLYVPTSQGLAKQIVLTIPITHVTTDQVINLSLTDGQIIPTTVGELLKLAMPKNMFQDDVTGEKIINELMKFSEQTSVYLAEYMKIALEHSKKYFNENKGKIEENDDEINSDSKNVKEDEKSPIKHEEESEFISKSEDIIPNVEKSTGEVDPNPIRSDTNTTMQQNRRRTPVNCNAENLSQPEINTTLKHKSLKRLHDSHNYSDIRSPKALNNHRVHNEFPMHLFNSEKTDKNITATVAKEEPTSTINHDENCSKLDANLRSERSSSTDSYDENDLDEIKEFAKSFKLRRLSMGLTQTQVGQALNITEGPAYSQSAICSALASHVYAAQIASQQHSIFEKLDITPKSAQKIKPVLERWMKEAEERNGQGLLTEFIGMESSKKRKRRTSFTPQALEILNNHFEHNTHPSGTEITALAHQLGYDREVIRIWFCNKRQALKNTVRMMSKHIM
ncbi:uncharacterized protein pdm3 isoform X2 [Planococcus citri]|uniref:uncharacterized protein pdm3 isoform X2 n=1 Tax=Planococcus citri TaxID=170843 RepID=UPI0031F7F509